MKSSLSDMNRAQAQAIKMIDITEQAVGHLGPGEKGLVERNLEELKKIAEEGEELSLPANHHGGRIFSWKLQGLDRAGSRAGHKACHLHQVAEGHCACCKGPSTSCVSNLGNQVALVLWFTN